MPLWFDRLCPGRYYALNNVWILAASMVAIFDFLKPLDAAGKEVIPAVEFTSGGLVW